jgi:hypothetical protein
MRETSERAKLLRDLAKIERKIERATNRVLEFTAERDAILERLGYQTKGEPTITTSTVPCAQFGQ